jgi:hypothetical protein
MPAGGELPESGFVTRTGNGKFAKSYCGNQDRYFSAFSGFARFSGISMNTHEMNNTL